MKAGFYPRLALDGIRKNRKLYLPYLLTCVGMVMMYYIDVYLSDIRGETTAYIMMLGSFVIAAFSLIFLFYSNSFLLRRRKREFGLYNILGMSKGNLSMILFFEVLIIYIVSMISGLLLGILLSKLFELIFDKIMGSETTFTMQISMQGIFMTLAVFSVIFVLLLLNAMIQVRRSTAAQLIKSENVGEKPPKGNWFFGLLGIILLAGAYYIALSIKNPLSAMMGFFIAVVMVIVGTYLMMIAGSVLLCRILQKRKRYYYKPNHFVSVSSMVYRMKRNGAGLASICILATMVLVMISSTSSLWFGTESALTARYPRELNIEAQYSTFSEKERESIDIISDEVERIAAEHNCVPKNVQSYRIGLVAGYVKDGAVQTDTAAVDEFSLNTFQDVVIFTFMPLEDYNRLTDSDISLNDGEALMISEKYDYQEDTIAFADGRTLTIKARSDEPPLAHDAMENIVPGIYLIVPDMENATQGMNETVLENGGNLVQFHYYYQFDDGLKQDEKEALFIDLHDALTASDAYDSYGFSGISIEDRDARRADYYALYGSLFYLGIVLSLVFILAAVLIIYYKQITEGYEDEERFDIMQKVGMTAREIKKSINSQLLTVFFAPLLLADVHLIFAFPIVHKMLILLGLGDLKVFILSTVVSFTVFALLYALVYRITSRAYYKIVSGNHNG